MKKNKSVRGFIFTSILSLVPSSLFAQTATTDVTKGITTFGTIISTITSSIIKNLITLFATAAMAAFFFGIVQYLLGMRDGDATKSKNGKNFMLWGMIALFVMFSVWGIITYTQDIIGIKGRNTIIIPDVQIGGSAVGTGGTGSGLNDCTTAGASCFINGAAGTCVQGSAARDYALYCSPVTSGGSGADTGNGDTWYDGATTQSPLGYCPDGSPYYTESGRNACPAGASSGVDSYVCASTQDAETCRIRGCSWSDADLECSP